MLYNPNRYFTLTKDQLKDNRKHPRESPITMIKYLEDGCKMKSNPLTKKKNRNKRTM